MEEVIDIEVRLLYYIYNYIWFIILIPNNCTYTIGIYYIIYNTYIIEYIYIYIYINHKLVTIFCTSSIFLLIY